MSKQPDRLMLPDDWSVNAFRWEGGLAPEGLFCEVFDWSQLPDYQLDYHTGVELGILLEGRMFRQFEHYGFEIGPGEVWLCAMWEPHGWGKISSEGKCVVFVFLPDFLGDEKFEELFWLNLFAAPPSERPCVSLDGMKNIVLAIGQDLANEVNEQKPMWKSLVRLGVLRVLALLARDWNPKTLAVVKKKIRTSDLSRLSPALDLVHQQPLRAIKLREAARACNFSTGYFAQEFRHVMGLSFGEFQLRARLGCVARRLLSTNATIEDIAAEVGFVDASHLIHAFQKHYACTPGQYRIQKSANKLEDW